MFNFIWQESEDDDDEDEEDDDEEEEEDEDEEVKARGKRGLKHTEAMSIFISIKAAHEIRILLSCAICFIIAL